MKNFFKLFGIIALVAVIGFSMAACGEDDGGKDGRKDVLDGTMWQATVYNEDSEASIMTITFNSPNFTLALNNVPQTTGTYSISGNNVQLTARGFSELGSLSGNTLLFDSGKIFTKR